VCAHSSGFRRKTGNPQRVTVKTEDRHSHEFPPTEQVCSRKGDPTEKGLTLFSIFKTVSLLLNRNKLDVCWLFSTHLLNPSQPFLALCPEKLASRGSITRLPWPLFAIGFGQ
jgi:hypothetical protein